MNEAYAQDAEQLRVVVDATRQLVQSHDDYRELLATAMRTLSVALDGACILALVDPTEDVLEAVGVYHPDAELCATVSSVVPPRWPVGRGFAGRVAMTRLPVRMSQKVLCAELDRVPARVRDVVQAIETRTLLAVPLVAADTLLGTMSVARFGADAEEFSAEDTALAEQLAARAAALLRSSRTIAAQQAELAARTERLERQNSELSAFANSAAHDLRAPVRTSMGLLAALHEDHGHEMSPGALGIVDRLVDTVGRMESVVSDLLRLALPGSAAALRESVDLTAVVDRWIDRSDTGQVVWSVARGMTVHADPGLVERLLDNLLGNAVKFTAQSATPQVDVFVDHQDGQWWTVVRDNGIGFGSADTGRIFEPFTRLADGQAYEGTGLGLSIARRIVHLHAGRIEARPAPAGGAELRFTLEATSRSDH